MVTKLRRRSVLQAGGAAAVSAFASCTSATTQAAPAQAALIQDPKGLLDLPPGFTYRVLQRAGDPMSDGYRVPARPDAMGCFPGPNGSIVLMRNQEVTPNDMAGSPYAPGQAPAPEAYDPRGTGGVTRLVLDPKTLAIERSNLVLAGTYWNCAGGLSPWGWLSCEEYPDEPRHGYVFLCATDAERVQPPRRLVGYGRMRHEAASVDPKTHIGYLTEDRPDGCFYRFVPERHDKPFEGKLQAMRVRGHAMFDTARMAAGDSAPIDWVDVEQPDSPDDSVRMQAQAKGAARVCRGEGLWLGSREAFFCATQGGRLGRGQVFRLAFGPPAVLEVVAEADERDVLDMPDNLCVSPQGQLFVAEDGSNGNFIRRVGVDGSIATFARNAASPGEFAGPCFAPDGRTLFVNVQSDGVTFAISGPFERLGFAAGERAAKAAGAPRAALGPDYARGVRGITGGLAAVALAAFVRRRRLRNAPAS
jgi:secreted PhoX family phosphatase